MNQTKTEQKLNPAPVQTSHMWIQINTVSNKILEIRSTPEQSTSGSSEQQKSKVISNEARVGVLVNHTNLFKKH